MVPGNIPRKSAAQRARLRARAAVRRSGMHYATAAELAAKRKRENAKVNR